MKAIKTKKYIPILLAFFVSTITTQGQTNKKSAAKPAQQKTEVVFDKNSYFPFCKKINYTYEERTLFTHGDLTATYTLFNTYNVKGTKIYGYKVEEPTGRMGNVYYCYVKGMLIEQYEVPTITTTNLGTTEETVDVLKAPTWDNTQTVTHTESELNYESGNLITTKLLDINKNAGDSWVDSAEINYSPVKITHTVLEKRPTLTSTNGHVFTDVIIMLRKIVMDGNLMSLQKIIYAKGLGIIGIINVKGDNFDQGFIKTDRLLTAFQSSSPAINQFQEEKYEFVSFEDLDAANVEKATPDSSIAIHKKEKVEDPLTQYVWTFSTTADDGPSTGKKITDVFWFKADGTYEYHCNYKKQNEKIVEVYDHFIVVLNSNRWHKENWKIEVSSNGTHWEPGFRILLDNGKPGICLGMDNDIYKPKPLDYLQDK